MSYAPAKFFTINTASLAATTGVGDVTLTLAGVKALPKFISATLQAPSTASKGGAVTQVGAPTLVSGTATVVFRVSNLSAAAAVFTVNVRVDP